MRYLCILRDLKILFLFKIVVDTNHESFYNVIINTKEHIMNKVFKFYADAGHGWLAVKISDLNKVGLYLIDISNYSYIRGKTIYLEEDGDAAKFFKAYEATYGEAPKYVEKYADRSPIRSYDMLYNHRPIAA